eukprot:CAMPEP_0182528858 /NCGR_PEP_ID=MMETSP1323-20130603/4784_1 /TAXON_ID=236787 /ORGANISM="Florenciella parvula, Strain RCC1693" /LENGTH=58 /DNA_ID=CAMNT_0024738025 /DNA_START=559 /DNA_END=735 /DNA_ORIENTATION=-
MAQLHLEAPRSAMSKPMAVDRHQAALRTSSGSTMESTLGSALRAAAREGVQKLGAAAG